MSRRLVLTGGQIPARKAVAQAAAQMALHALVEDLGHPGVYRDANYDLIRVIAGLETNDRRFTVTGLDDLVKFYRLEGKAEDSVCDLIQVYVDARRKLGE